jgi:tRNA (guanine-N7-)-methyltransferase
MAFHLIHDYAHLLLPQQDVPYDFAAIFGNANPVVLEVGSGKGRFLIAQAEANAGTNFIGIEWANKYCNLCANRAAGHKLTNIRFLRDDAAHTFRLALSDACLEGIHVLFPDPWPKKKQKRRRLIQPPFLDQVCRVVRPGGFLALATDHADYFAQMDEVTAAHPGVEVTERLVGESARVGITNFEQKYRAEGRTIHNIMCRIRGPVPVRAPVPKRQPRRPAPDAAPGTAHAVE